MFDKKYLFQSKNPKRFADFELPPKSVVCTTIETNRWYPEIMIMHHIRKNVQMQWNLPANDTQHMSQSNQLWTST
ncbi:MAG TPA: hypothetical protein VEP89_00965 [Draconibacterium sp.]|nr:hypothetical protein [Draconibacterium sp.]